MFRMCMNAWVCIVRRLCIEFLHWFFFFFFFAYVLFSFVLYRFALNMTAIRNSLESMVDDSRPDGGLYTISNYLNVRETSTKITTTRVYILFQWNCNVYSSQTLQGTKYIYIHIYIYAKLKIETATAMCREVKRANQSAL